MFFCAQVKSPNEGRGEEAGLGGCLEAGWVESFGFHFYWSLEKHTQKDNINQALLLKV